jgi:hypothetical protein
MPAAKRRKPDAATWFEVSLSSDGPLSSLWSMVIAATDPAAARSAAEARFPEALVLKVRKKNVAADSAAFPSARFIKGEFLPSIFADEPRLRTLGK